MGSEVPYFKVPCLSTDVDGSAPSVCGLDCRKLSEWVEDMRRYVFSRFTLALSGSSRCHLASITTAVSNSGELDNGRGATSVLSTRLVLLMLWKLPSPSEQYVVLLRKRD